MSTRRTTRLQEQKGSGDESQSQEQGEGQEQEQGEGSEPKETEPTDTEKMTNPDPNKSGKGLEEAIITVTSIAESLAKKAAQNPAIADAVAHLKTAVHKLNNIAGTGGADTSSK